MSCKTSGAVYVWEELRLVGLHSVLVNVPLAALPVTAQAEWINEQGRLVSSHVLELRPAAEKGTTTTDCSRAHDVFMESFQWTKLLLQDVQVIVTESTHEAHHDHDHDALLLGLIMILVDAPPVVHDLTGDINVVRAVLHACLDHRLADEQVRAGGCNDNTGHFGHPIQVLLGLCLDDTGVRFAVLRELLQLLLVAARDRPLLVGLS
mmetsp:Transcript_33141/g.45047  ORF Transcript_33141/g.45047 Transcript_33141/m.45047 type:complete len:207 (-) Transcript_33141:176-796(-)